MNIRNTTRRISGRNTFKEHLVYNEKERNVKNINIAFEPHQMFDQCKNFIDPFTPPTLKFSTTPKLYEPMRPTPPTQFFWPTPKFYELTQFTPPTSKVDQCHPRTHTPNLSTLPTLFRKLVFKAFSRKVLFIIRKDNKNC